MSPCKTSERDGFLEYPTEALGYYRDHGVESVICEEKHMGSRAVTVVCRGPETALERFGVDTGESGFIVTRTGRRFFDDPDTETTLVGRLVKAAESSGLFDELETGWLLLDLELMPWSAKAQGLLKEQYAPVGSAARESARFVDQILKQASAQGVTDLAAAVGRAAGRADASQRFVDAYRRYCWRVNSIDDYKLACFHLLASECAVHVDKNHRWHMDMLARLADEDQAILIKTPYRVVNLASESEVAETCAWWEQLVGAGGEGMVVKPLDFMARHGGHVLQPAIKCRGPEYLRIIYGPEYLVPENLSRLRSRGLNRKRSLASREFALGLEATERFVRREPLRRVHECVFGVLALESEPVDPRL
jgi:hypothetical protein